ncbi:MAG: hypothetical protein ACNA8W_18525 [Bradymonadaceae bacterium]
MLFLAACTDDLYADCTLDPDDSLLQRCVNESGETQTSCVVQDQLQCETRICGRYQGSSPFCTIECAADSDCDNGECREFVYQSETKYCVNNDNLPK